MTDYIDFCKVVEMTTFNEKPQIIGSTSTSARSEVQFEWTIPDFLTHSFGIYESPSFFFINHTWYLRMFPTKKHISIYLYIKDVSSDDITVKLTSFIKTSSGKLERGGTTDCTFKKGQSYTGWKYSWKRSDLLARESEVLPSGKLTLIINCSANVQVTEAEKQITGLESLSANLENLFITKNHCDVTFKVKSKEFRAHKAILVARSPVFAAAFEHKMSEKETNVIKIHDCEPDPFWDFLQYLYTGKVTDIALKNVIQLYITADKYDVKELKSFCLFHMMQNLTLENICDIVCVAEQYEETGLFCAAQTFFNHNTSAIVATAQWDGLMEINSCLANKLIKGIFSASKPKK